MEILLYIGACLLMVVFGWQEGIKHERKVRRPVSVLDKKGDVVLDYNHMTRGAIIFHGMNPIYGIVRKGRESGSIVLTKQDGSSMTLGMDEAHQLGRALQYVSWREDL